MTDRGSIARNALVKSGLMKKYVSERMNIDPKTLENKLQRADLEYDFIIRLYKVFRMDVTEDFPELAQYIINEQIEGTEEANQELNKALDDCKNELEMWKNKYIKLMEEYNQVLKENRDLLTKQANRGV